MERPLVAGDAMRPNQMCLSILLIGFGIFVWVYYGAGSAPQQAQAGASSEKVDSHIKSESADFGDNSTKSAGHYDPPSADADRYTAAEHGGGAVTGLENQRVNAAIRAFFFKPDAWDSARIMSSDVFNPRHVDIDAESLRMVEALIDDAREELSVPIRGLLHAASAELSEIAKSGKARLGPALVVTKEDGSANSSYTFSMRRPKGADVQLGTGDGRTYVAQWHELGRTKHLRSLLATQICDHICRVVECLESRLILTAQEVNQIVYVSVDMAVRFQQ